MEKTDEQLIYDYIEGDEEAFKKLMYRYLKPIYNFSLRISKIENLAEDITQETFIKVWKNIKKFKKDGSFKPWIFSIAHNMAIDYMRKKNEVAFSDFEIKTDDEKFEDSLIDQDLLPNEVFELAEKAKILNESLNQLPLIYREVLSLRYSSNMTFEEIGIVLKKPLDTVKSQHRRALQKMKEMLVKKQ